MSTPVQSLRPATHLQMAVLELRMRLTIMPGEDSLCMLDLFFAPIGRLGMPAPQQHTSQPGVVEVNTYKMLAQSRRTASCIRYCPLNFFR